MDACLVLNDFISRSRIPHIIYRLKSRSLVVFFRMVHNEKIFRSLNVKRQNFLERQREVIYFPFVVRKTVSEFSKNFSWNCKSREISAPYNFLTPMKSSIPDVWKWNCWTPCLVWKMKWGVWPFYTPSGSYDLAHVHFIL